MRSSSRKVSPIKKNFLEEINEDGPKRDLIDELVEERKS